MEPITVHVALADEKVKFIGTSAAQPALSVPMDYVPPLGSGEGFLGLELLAIPWLLSRLSIALMMGLLLLILMFFAVLVPFSMAAAAEEASPITALRPAGEKPPR